MAGPVPAIPIVWSGVPFRSGSPARGRWWRTGGCSVRLRVCREPA